MRDRLGDVVSQLAAAAGLIIVFVALSIASPYFLTSNNLFNIGVQVAVVAIIAVGQTLVILTAGIDLSVGSVAGFSGVVGAMAIAQAGIPVIPGVIIGILVGGVIGVVNGLLVTQMRLPPFIATLGMLGVARGLTFIVGGETAVYGLPDKFRLIGEGQIGPIPLPLFYLIVIAAIGYVVLSRTKLGRYAYAIGSNKEAARLSGIPLNRYVIGVYVISAALAGFGGMIAASRVHSGQPNYGVGLELDVIAACVIGGASLFGGVGTIGGTLIGAFLMAVIRDGAVLLNITQYYQQVIIGVIIWMAVWWDQVRRRRLAAATEQEHGRRGADAGDGEPGGGSRGRSDPPRAKRTRPGAPMRARRLLLAALLPLAGAAAGCAVVKQHEGKITLQGVPPIHLAVIPKSVGLDYWSKVHSGAQCAASQLPQVKVTWNGVTDETDVVGQLDLLNNYVAQGVNGLVYAATDATAMNEVSTSATKAGVKVVGIDSGTQPQPANVPLLETDNIAAAKLAADQLAAAIGPKGGKVAIIAFHAGSQTNDQRVQGFEAGLKKHPNLHLAAIQYSQNDYNTALTVSANVLTANPDLKGFFAANESSDIGAVEAVRLAHMTGKVKIVGWDTSPDEVQGVRQGIVSGLISQNPFRMGYDGVRAAVTMLRHQGTVKSENTGVVVVTKSNLTNAKVRQFIAPRCGSSRLVDVG